VSKANAKIVINGHEIPITSLTVLRRRHAGDIVGLSTGIRLGKSQDEVYFDAILPHDSAIDWLKGFGIEPDEVFREPAETHRFSKQPFREPEES
jgi:hypothetical protein